MIVESSNTVIASGEWADGGTWRIVPFSELPQELAERPDLCTAVGVVALYDPAGSDSLPRVVMTLRNKGRNGDPPEWETASGKVDPADPNDPKGPREDLEETGRRECVEELGVELEDVLIPFAVRISKNSSESIWPGYSYMKYYTGFVRGRVGVPSEDTHTSEAMWLEKIGELARMLPEEVDVSAKVFRASLVDVRLVRAAFLALAYTQAEVDAALGSLEDL